jgi:DNA polymerase III alpha subunit
MMDIDIDFADRTQVLDIIKHIKASRVDNDKAVVHNTGVYLQSIPHDPITNLASIEYKQAEARGYFKIDFLNVSVYKSIKNEEHLLFLMNQEPLWDLLLENDFTDNLFHVNGHGSVLREMKPASVEELAAVLAMIRPAKRHLIGKTWPEVMIEIWKKPENEEYYFKKAHAVAYAMAIVVQMNLICENISEGGA